MVNFENVVLLWFAFLIHTYLHEWGHGGRTEIVRLFPIPKGRSYGPYRYGGLIVSFALAAAIFYVTPSNVMLKFLGFAAWASFIFYTVVGSFNKEYRVPKELERYWVFDDVPNKLWYVFVPLGLFTFLWMKDYYFEVVKLLL